MSTNILNVKLNNNIYPSYEYTTSYSAVYTSSTISNLSADQLENYITSSGNFITPMDYYGNAGNSITDDNVLYTDSSEKDNTKYYWWCESLKNWCFFEHLKARIQCFYQKSERLIFVVQKSKPKPL